MFAGASPTEQHIEVESRGRIFPTTWDPRETGTILFISQAEWSTEGAPPSAAEQNAILDATFRLAREQLGVKAAVEVVGDVLVIRRAADKRAHWLRVSETFVSWLELGATVQIPRVSKPDNLPQPPEPPRVAWLDLERAQRVHPTPPAACDPAQRERMARALAKPHELADFILTDFVWQFALATGQRHAAG